MPDASPSKTARQLAGDAGGKSRQDHDTQLLIDAKAAATILALGARTLWTLTKCGAVPVRRIGRSVRYCPAELRGWIAAGCPTEPGSADRLGLSQGTGPGRHRKGVRR